MWPRPCSCERCLWLSLLPSPPVSLLWFCSCGETNKCHLSDTSSLTLLWDPSTRRDRITTMATMDPAELDKVKQAITSQGALVGQHDRALQEIMSSLQHLSTGVNRLGGRLDEVSSQLTSLKSSDHAPSVDLNPAPSPAPPPVPASQLREPFIPTPSRFSGEPGLCKPFLHQCRLVFEQQPFSYSSDRARVAFIMSLLSGKASAWAVALSGGNSPLCESLPLFTAEMLRVFDHPLEGKETSNRLLALRQGSGPVSAYSIDFRILAAECGWDEKALTGIFYRGLREDIKDELAARDETSSLEELISLSTRLDNRLRERRRERAGGTPYSSRFSPPELRHQPVSPPAAAQRAATPTSAPIQLVSSEEPMQLGRTRLSAEERQRRFHQGLCIYCGLSGHLRRSCPARPKDQAHQAQEGHW
uniref:CCHC-type domain-containing protein n=1 Tax=Oryzias latipes TaxID=8090 RepID=A0A3P9LPJ3_ORYLA